MRYSVRKKIGTAFLSLVILGGMIWFFSDYRNFVLSQKLHIIISKNQVMNNILEARRYEKNYFLYLNGGDLSEALSYVTLADDRLQGIIRDYGEYTHTSIRELEQTGKKLDEYEKSLEAIEKYHFANAVPPDPEQLSDPFTAQMSEFRKLGREITEHL